MDISLFKKLDEKKKARQAKKHTDSMERVKTLAIVRSIKDANEMKIEELLEIMKREGA